MQFVIELLESLTFFRFASVFSSIIIVRFIINLFGDIVVFEIFFSKLKVRLVESF